MNLAPVLQLGLMLSDVRVDFGLQACWHLVLVGLRVLSAGTIPTLDGGLPAEVGVQVDDLIPAVESFPLLNLLLSCWMAGVGSELRQVGDEPGVDDSASDELPTGLRHILVVVSQLIS